MNKDVFITYPILFTLACITWHFFIAGNGVEAFETSMMYLIFYYFGASVYYCYFDSNNDD